MVPNDTLKARGSTAAHGFDPGGPKTWKSPLKSWPIKSAAEVSPAILEIPDETRREGKNGASSSENRTEMSPPRVTPQPGTPGVIERSPDDRIPMTTQPKKNAILEIPDETRREKKNGAIQATEVPPTEDAAPKEVVPPQGNPGAAGKCRNLIQNAQGKCQNQIRGKPIYKPSTDLADTSGGNAEALDTASTEVVPPPGNPGAAHKRPPKKLRQDERVPSQLLQFSVYVERFQDGLKAKATRTDLDRIEAAMVKVFMKEDDKVAEDIQADCIKTVHNRDAGEIIFFNYSSTARDYLIEKINAMKIKDLKARGRRATPPNLQVEVPASMPGRPEQYLESVLRRAAKIKEPNFQCVRVRGPNGWGARLVDCILDEAGMLKLQSWVVDTGAQALPLFPVEMRFWILHSVQEKACGRSENTRKASVAPMDTAEKEEVTPREALATENATETKEETPRDDPVVKELANLDVEEANDASKVQVNSIDAKVQVPNRSNCTNTKNPSKESAVDHTDTQEPVGSSKVSKSNVPSPTKPNNLVPSGPVSPNTSNSGLEPNRSDRSNTKSPSKGVPLEPNGSSSTNGSNCTNTNYPTMGLTPLNAYTGPKGNKKSMDIRVLLARQAANATANTRSNQDPKDHHTKKLSPKGPQTTRGGLEKTPLPPKIPGRPGKKTPRPVMTGSIATDRTKRECTKPARRALMLNPFAL